MEHLPEDPLHPFTVDQIRDFLQHRVDACESEDELSEYGGSLTQIIEEIQEMYTNELLNQSISWHTLKGSSLPDNAPRLPEGVEIGVARVITDLLKRRFKLDSAEHS